MHDLFLLQVCQSLHHLCCVSSCHLNTELLYNRYQNYNRDCRVRCVNLLAEERRSAMSPFSQFSNTKYKFSSSYKKRMIVNKQLQLWVKLTIVVASNLIMKGWSISFSKSFSLKMCLSLPNLLIWLLLTDLIATTFYVVFSFDKMTFPYAPSPTTLPNSKSAIVDLVFCSDGTGPTLPAEVAVVDERPASSP